VPQRRQGDTQVGDGVQRLQDPQEREREDDLAVVAAVDEPVDHDRSRRVEVITGGRLDPQAAVGDSLERPDQRRVVGDEQPRPPVDRGETDGPEKECETEPVAKDDSAEQTLEPVRRCLFPVSSSPSSCSSSLLWRLCGAHRATTTVTGFE